MIRQVGNTKFGRYERTPHYSKWLIFTVLLSLVGLSIFSEFQSPSYDWELLSTRIWTAVGILTFIFSAVATLLLLYFGWDKHIWTEYTLNSDGSKHYLYRGEFREHKFDRD